MQFKYGYRVISVYDYYWSELAVWFLNELKIL